MFLTHLPGLRTTMSLVAGFIGLIAWPEFATAAGERQAHGAQYVPPSPSQMPALPYKCQSADGSRDFPVTEVRRLPGDQNVFWATMRTLGLSREEAQALKMQCQLANRPSKGNYACRTLVTFRGDPGEIMMPANSIEEARGFSVNKLGDAPIRCRELKAGEAVDNTTPRINPLDGPFSRITMGDYFNAIYNDEPEVVRYLDKKYLGQLISQVKGGFGDNVIWKKIVEAMQLDKATLAVAAIREYTLQYEKNYGQCLRKDAVSFTRTFTTLRNGVAISKTEEHFRVNPEFAAAFKATGATAETVGDALGDMWYGSPLARTETGIAEVMSAFRCDNPVIKQFETRLLRIAGFAR
jgi:hypothetical protein